MSDDQNYDAIIIGSGLGAMTTASILAKLHKKRVLVLERHYVLGGFTHVFKRPGNHEWDVGIHYIGEVGEGTTMRKIFDFITDGQLKWAQMPNEFDKFVYPDFTFGQQSNPKAFKQDLIDKFPTEKEGIETYFADLRKMKQWNYFRLLAEGNSGLLRWFFKGKKEKLDTLALTTTQEVLNRHFTDPKIKALVASQWGDHGYPPSKSAFASHALIVNHYLYGGYYPVGGASKIADYVVPIVEKQGGKFLINHEVQEIIVENGQAVGVKVLKKKGKGGEVVRYNAPAVISNAGAYLTYGKMLPEEIGGAYAKELEPLIPDTTTAVLYLGLKEGPEKMGFEGENHWIFDGYDHEEYADSGGPFDGPAKGCYLSFPSLKNPDAVTHTAEVIGFVSYDKFAQWAGEPWKKRGDEYEALKEEVSENLLALVEKKYPGFKDLIVYKELSTPLSTEHFTGSPKGSIYGMGSSPERYKNKTLAVKTPIKNLYLTGADAFIFGIGGALIAGVATAAHLSGRFGFFRNWKTIMAEKR
ncbi:MAG: NAD(P)/FAD-dependent oxidoreductase [Rhodospirillales bacterium]|nr:NAD(P)/FAD-dependent oxidoreductase [Rhodospirillales bacterium]